MGSFNLSTCKTGCRYPRVYWMDIVRSFPDPAFYFVAYIDLLDRSDELAAFSHLPRTPREHQVVAQAVWDAGVVVRNVRDSVSRWIREGTQRNAPTAEVHRQLFPIQRHRDVICLPEKRVSRSPLKPHAGTSPRVRQRAAPAESALPASARWEAIESRTHFEVPKLCSARCGGIADLGGTI